MTTKICAKCGMSQSGTVCERCGGTRYVSYLSDDQLEAIMQGNGAARGCLKVIVYMFLFTVAVLLMVAALPVGILALVILFLSIGKTMRGSSDRLERLIEQMLNGPIYDRFYAPEYSHEKSFSAKILRQTGLFSQNWEYDTGSQLLKGERSGIQFEMGNYNLYNQVTNEKGFLERRDVYRGYLVNCKMSQTISGKICVTPKSYEDRTDFDTTYEVAGENKALCDAILTWEMKDALMSFSRIAEKPCRFSFTGDQFYAAIEGKQVEYFRLKNAEGVRQTIKNELDWQTRLIDALGRGGELLQTSIAEVSSGMSFE